ncbi:MAG: M20 family metallopeptidase [Candidatus Peribacter sp.]|jgi:succinyl-diaminopimelate desuccinylase|nr:M20 family metallopeptidase [Candidatus Peribacter sp.]MBT4392454.1 M20 family metallopeptidase [Candidatus Peribacter sp.]MBT4601216.1 M20 family metallopeptidase [Candidatus Peribacter sp.]MBT5149265.1 M20 family metallopeptidase [Candidatus Peribacter sp.]MBT5637089.1 M20 family metallopeptidase [Candidatus Peribacter sp.]
MTTVCEKEELLNLLKVFISFKSVDGEGIYKTECLDWIQTAFLGSTKSAVQRGDFEGSPWLYMPSGDCKLLVFAHCDVVPASDEMFELSIEGDSAKGRGTSDMKGNILPFLMAYRDAIEEGTQPPISILITTDEEVAGNTIPHLIDTGVVTAPVAFTPDSNDLGIVCQHKGVVWSELICSGKGGHGAYPWDTDNPAWLLVEALAKIKEAFPPGEHDDWQITVSPTMLQGSSARNQVDAKVTCGLDIRFPPETCSSPKEALEKVSAILPEGCEIREVLSASPLSTPENHPMVEMFKEVAEEVLDTSIGFKREHGGTDARYFSEKGIPAFLYGPKGAGLHSKDEWVSVSSLQKHYKMYWGLFNKILA